MITAQCVGFLNTAPLWEKEQFDIPQFEFPVLALEGFQPQPIPDNIRLGHQMEYVFKQLVEYSGAYSVMLHNLPIRAGDRTLGEIDFLLAEKTTNKLIHVELTYKFYLLDPDIPEPIHQLIGPNRRDSFFDKKEKIKHKQFPILHTAGGVKALADHQIDHTEVEHQCCFKAQLFLPFGGKANLLDSLNEASIAGYWLRLEEFNRPQFVSAQFYIPTKSEWAIEPHEHVNWVSHKEAVVDIQERLVRERAPMLWLKTAGGELEKIFVVWW